MMMMSKEQILSLTTTAADKLAFVAFEESRGAVLTKSLQKIGFLDRSNTIQPKLWDRRTSTSGPNPDTELYLVQIVGQNPKGTVFFLKIIGSLKEVREILAPREKYEQAQAMLAAYVQRELPTLEQMPNLLVFFKGKGAYKTVQIGGEEFTIDVDLDRLYYDEVERYVEGMKRYFAEVA